MASKKIKIFLSYHKKSQLLKSDVFQPIHVGRSLHDIMPDSWLAQNLIGDNTGKNISEKNLNYCELTAQYWAWKNVTDVDYVGFMHYRRHLNFHPRKKYHIDMWGLTRSDYLDDSYIRKYGLDDKNIKKQIEKYDVITVQPWDVRNASSTSNYHHYQKSDKLFIKDYDLALKILKKKYPEYTAAANKYNASHMGYYTNIFVMRKDIFDDYCKWLFDILFAVENKSDISEYNYQEARIYGYISEWLFGIYMTYLKDNTKLKIKELQRTMIEDTDIKEPMDIVFAADEKYAPHMGVTIASILRNRSPQDKFNFYVIDGGICDETKRRIEKLKRIADFNIQYLDIDQRMFDSYPIDPNSHFNHVVYYRLAMPSILPNLHRVLYLDTDLIIRGSLRELYDSDMTDLCCLGVCDILVNENTRRLQIDKYVNSGVLMMNLDEWRKFNAEQKFKDYIAAHHDDIVWPDQDVINFVLNDKIKYVDDIWNCQLVYSQNARSEHFRKIQKRSRIIHFISAKKPWHGNAFKYDRIYYSVLRHTPWRAQNYKYVLAKIRMLGKTVIRKLFSVTNTKYRVYRQISLLGCEFFVKRRHHAPSVMPYVLKRGLINIIPIRGLRKSYRKKLVASINRCAWRAYSHGIRRDIIADFCLTAIDRHMQSVFPHRLKLVLIHSVAELNDWSYVWYLCEKYNFIPDFENPKPIELLFGATSDYLPYAMVTALSAIKNANGRRFNIHFIYADIVKPITDEHRCRLFDMARNTLRGLNATINFYDVSDLISLFDGQNIGMWGREISMTHYLYLLAPRVLPDDIERVIYLDTDMVVNCDLSDVFDLATYKPVVAASPSGFEEEKDTFNSGFLMLNLSAWRQRNILDKLLDFGRALPRCELCDQNLLNNYFGHGVDIGFVDRAYNLFPQCEPDMNLSELKIIHYAGWEFGRPLTKPWKEPTKLKADIWWEWARQTAFYEILILNLLGGTK